MSTERARLPEQGHGEGILLIVDDEENILRALMRVFRREGYRILTATSGEAGLEMLREHPVNVVLSDMRMPHMNGVEFLNKVKEMYPDTIRIVLSGYTDLDSVTEAINRGAIYKFLSKPWDDELLRENIRKAFQKNESGRGAGPDAAPDQMHGLLNGLAVGILDIDADGRVRVLNTEAATLLGRSVQELVNATTEALPQPLQSLISGVASGRSRGRTEFASGDGGTVEAHAAWYDDRSDGQAGGVAVTLGRSGARRSTP